MTTACCASAACCPAVVPALPEFALRGASAWPAAVGFALLAAGTVAAGWAVLAQVATAFAALNAAP